MLPTTATAEDPCRCRLSTAGNPYDFSRVRLPRDLSFILDCLDGVHGLPTFISTARGSSTAWQTPHSVPDIFVEWYCQGCEEGIQLLNARRKGGNPSATVTGTLDGAD